MAELNTEQWQAQRLEHWLVREWARAFAEQLSEAAAGDSAREVELDPREPQLEKWQAWEEPLWFDLASDAGEGALVSVGCAKPTADRIAAAIAGEDAEARDTYVEFLNKVRGKFSEAVAERLRRSVEFAEAGESERPEEADFGVEFAFKLDDAECVPAFVPNKAFLETIQPGEKNQGGEKEDESGEIVQPSGDGVAEQDEGAEQEKATQEEDQSAEEDEPGSDEKPPEETGAADDGSSKEGDKAAKSDKKSPKAGEQAQTNLSMLLDIELDLSVSFGKTSLPMQEVLKLASGSIVELNRGVSEPVDVMVNNCVIARGKVVVVEGNYGIRITEILSRKERIRSIL